MKALRRIAGVFYKDIINNEVVIKITGLADLGLGYDHDVLALFTKDKITMH